MLPRSYDKSAYSGKGDRADPATWPRAAGPLDVVLFEGWMLGFAPVGDAEAAGVDANLAPVNAFLRRHAPAAGCLRGLGCCLEPLRGRSHGGRPALPTAPNFLRTRSLPASPLISLPPLTPHLSSRSYKEAWDSSVDSWLVVRVAQPDYAYRWRLQAEQAMRASGKSAMTDEQVRGAAVLSRGGEPESPGSASMHPALLSPSQQRTAACSAATAASPNPS